MVKRGLDLGEEPTPEDSDPIPYPLEETFWQCEVLEKRFVLQYRFNHEEVVVFQMIPNPALSQPDKVLHA